MMIAIATGIEILDKAINERLNGEIIYFREYLIRDENKYETVILSENLDGAITIEELTFKLREKNTRIIYIGKDYEDNPSLIKHLISIGVYDILFGETTVDDVINIYNNPKKFADISKIYSTVLSSPTIQIKSVPEVIKEKEVVVEKEKVIEKVIEKEKIVEVEKEKIVLLKPQVVTFWSMENSLDTAKLTYLLAKKLADEIKTTIALLDFEEITAKVSNIAKVKKSNIEAIIRLINNAEITFKSLTNNLQEKDNLLVFTGISINNFFIVNNKHLNTIVNLARNNLPYVLINAGAGIHTTGVASSILNADKIIAICDSTKNNLIHTLEAINFMNNHWDIEKERFNLFLLNESLTSEIDKGLAKELSETNEINFIGSAGRKIEKSLNRLFEVIKE